LRVLRRLTLLALLVIVDVGVAVQGMGGVAGERAWRPAPDAETVPRLVVLGFDGIDPRLVREFLDRGELPAIRALVERGGLHALASEIPPESPVAWASLQTGVNPGRHGVFDFVGRDPDRTGYAPVNGMVDFVPPPFLLGAVPTRPPRVESRLAYPTFLERVAAAGYRVLGLRPPLLFPVRSIPGARILSGLGTPDLAGTNGAYAFYDSGFTLRPEYTTFNGHLIHLDGGPTATTFQTFLEGPYDRTRREGGAHPRVTVPLRFARRLPDGPVAITLAGRTVEVARGESTPWMAARFSTRTLPSASLSGRVRFAVQSVEPLQVLAEPVQLDARDPALPISTPRDFAAALEDEGGAFATNGWLEPTFPLNDGLMAPQTFVKHVLEQMDRDHAMLRSELARGAPLVFHVFTQTDRTSHCFWWLRDPGHPFHDAARAAAFAGRDPILETYRRMDAVVGDVASRIADRDVLLVVSDHGFQSFRYGFNVNQFLVNEGWLVLKYGTGAVGEGNLHDFFSGSLTADAIDWKRTRAYALGLGQIYVNRQGREPEGIVDGDDVPALVSAIRERLLAYRDAAHEGRAPVAVAYDLATVYEGPLTSRAGEIQLGFAKDYRVSWQTALLTDLRPAGTDPVSENGYPWSGDHCSTERDLVPGVLLANRRLPPAPSGSPYHVRDVAATVLAHFRIDASDLDGKPLPLPPRD
jgi:predicted AlkP superfamily phosphohydrolase/phosphomutase